MVLTNFLKRLFQWKGVFPGSAVYYPIIFYNCIPLVWLFHFNRFLVLYKRKFLSKGKCTINENLRCENKTSSCFVLKFNCSFMIIATHCWLMFLTLMCAVYMTIFTTKNVCILKKKAFYFIPKPSTLYYPITSIFAIFDTSFQDSKRQLNFLFNNYCAVNATFLTWLLNFISFRKNGEYFEEFDNYLTPLGIHTLRGTLINF